MWKSIPEPGHLKTGNKLRVEFVTGFPENLVVEYEIVENKEDRLLLRPLLCNGNLIPGNSRFYKKVNYYVLWNAGIRMWMEDEATG
jgi:hypothetical protein